jgi:RHS repeat-associated protein
MRDRRVPLMSSVRRLFAALLVILTPAVVAGQGPTITFVSPTPTNGSTVTAATVTIKWKACGTSGTQNDWRTYVNGVGMTPTQTNAAINDCSGGEYTTRKFYTLSNVTLIDGVNNFEAYVCDGTGCPNPGTYTRWVNHPSSTPTYAVAVTSLSGASKTAAAQSTTGSTVFRVNNNSSNAGGSHTFAFTALCAGVLSCSNPSNVTINEGAFSDITVPYNVSLVGQNGSVALTATIVGQSASNNASITVNTTAYYAVQVSSSDVNLSAGATSGSVTHTVANNSSNTQASGATRTFTISRNCSTPLLYNCSGASSVALGDQASTNVTTTYDVNNVGNSATAQLTASATSPSFSHSASPTVSIPALQSVTVAPYPPSRNLAANTSADSSAFIVSNTSRNFSGTALFALTTGGCGGFTSVCTMGHPPNSVTLAQNQDSMVYVRYNVASAGTTGQAQLTASAAGWTASTGTVNLTITPVYGVQVLSTTSPSALAPQTTSGTATYTVRNTGKNTGALTFNLASSCSAVISSCATPSPSQVALTENQLSSPVSVGFNVSNVGTSGSVTLTATSGALNGSAFRTFSTTPWYSVTVVPGSGSQSTNAGDAGVYNVKIENTSWNLGGPISASVKGTGCAGAVVGGCSFPAAAFSLSQGQQTPNIPFRYSAIAPGSETITFTPTAVVPSQLNVVGGSVAITVSTSGPLTTIAKGINPGTVIERGDCLTIAAGANAAFECGDLRVVHALPQTTTLGTTRSPTLIYNSRHATGTGLIAANVIYTGGTTPDSIRATVSVGGGSPFSVAYPWNSQCASLSCRMVVPVPTRPTGAYSFTIETRAVAGSTVLATSAAISDTIIIVNRSTSPFGAGWWLQGYERLYPLPSANKWLWVGGDGSARVYDSTSAGVYVATTYDRPDTLLKVGSNWHRRLSNGAFVSFANIGRHESTRAELGWVTTFSYAGGTDTVPQSVNLPLPSGSSATRAYSFWYSAITGGPALDSIKSPTNAGVARTVKVRRSSGSFQVDSITDPDEVSTRFLYASGRMSARRNRQRDTVTFAYDLGGSLTQSTVAMSRTGGDDIVTGFRAAETAVLPAQQLQRLTGIHTIHNGPRAVNDTTRFFVNRWGAPDTIVNALGHRVRIHRLDARFPSMPTKSIAINGFEERAHFNYRGLLDSTVQVNPLLSPAGSPSTKFTWHPVWDEVVTTVSPTGQTSTDSIATAFPLVLWTQVGPDASRRTRVVYNANNLVDSLQPPGNTAAQRLKFAYDAVLGNVSQTTSAKGYISLFYRDSLGRDTLTVTPTSVATAMTVNNVLTNGTRVHTSYDAMGRVNYSRTAGPKLSTPTDTSALAVTTTYDSVGNVTQVIRVAIPDTNGIVALMDKYRYDAAGRRVAHRSPGSATPWDSTEYDPAGNPIKVITRRLDTLGMPYTLMMTYTPLNQIEQRVTPSVSYPKTSKSISFFDAAFYSIPDSLKYPRFPLGDANDATIVGDTTRFYYDSTGALSRATNRDARVWRAYHPNGLVSHDSLWIRPYSGSDSTIHRYGLKIDYDFAGRRTQLTHPAGLGHAATTFTTYQYDDTTGALKTTGDGINSFTLSYTSAGQLRSVLMPGGLQRRMGYDADGQLIADSVENPSPQGLNPLPSGYLRKSSIQYDARGKLVADTSAVGILARFHAVYNGLGQLIGNGYAATDFLNGPTVSSETHALDALGNSKGGQRGAPDVFWGNVAVPVTATYKNDGSGRLATQDWAGKTTGFEYDAAGNVAFDSTDVLNGRTDHAYYYDAENRLRAVDKRIASDHPVQSGRIWAYFFEEYRYDPLGRRVLVRSRNLCEGGVNDESQIAALCEASFIRRTVWDGSAELYEIQMPGEQGVSAATLENDTASVTVGASMVWPELDRNPFYGRVSYLYGAEIDQPLGVKRLKYADKFTGAVTPYPAFGLAPHWNVRGQADGGSTDDGGRTACINASTCIQYHHWQESYTPLQQQYMLRGNWHGTLLENKRDMSGSLFRRNRYVDPASGRFTQEDPIGLAGGLNLYGFAAGDPVNYSDPFGLCPVCVAYAIFEVGASLYDAYDLGKTAINFARGRASRAELGVTAAGAIAGVWSVGGGLGTAGRASLRSLTKRNFRENLARTTGGAVEGAHAHHIFPQEFGERFAKAGINVHDPQFGAWWEARSHLRNAAQYNAEWARFLGEARTGAEIMSFGRQISARYGITVRF